MSRIVRILDLMVLAVTLPISKLFKRDLPFSNLAGFLPNSVDGTVLAAQLRLKHSLFVIDVLVD